MASSAPNCHAQQGHQTLTHTALCGGRFLLFRLHQILAEHTSCISSSHYNCRTPSLPLRQLGVLPLSSPCVCVPKGPQMGTQPGSSCRLALTCERAAARWPGVSTLHLFSSSTLFPHSNSHASCATPLKRNIFHFG